MKIEGSDLKQIMLENTIPQVLQSVHDRFEQLVSKENFTKSCHLSGAKLETISLLESLCGIALAARGDNYKLIFDFLHPLLRESVKLLGNSCYT